MHLVGVSRHDAFTRLDSCVHEHSLAISRTKLEAPFFETLTFTLHISNGSAICIEER